MSFIQKVLAAECSDPCGEVRFVVVLSCQNLPAIRSCQKVFSALSGDLFDEEDGGDYQFLFMGNSGLDVDHVMLFLGQFLDEQQGKVELVETKFVNDHETEKPQHSFVFKSEGEPSDTTIILSPSHAFGSGDHPSTGLAIDFLEEMNPLACNVLDVGCGTGVLSFVALRLHARHVLGVDIDEKGLCGAAVNASLNQLDEQVQFENIPLTDIKGSFPVILANLTYSVLKYLLSDLSALATQNGALIVSGLQGRQGDDAQTVLQKFGWQVTRRKSSGKWQALLAVKVQG